MNKILAQTLQTAQGLFFLMTIDFVHCNAYIAL